ncbi:MAG: penicillin acylase family protein [Planctomycetota bacterium]
MKAWSVLGGLCVGCAVILASSAPSVAAEKSPSLDTQTLAKSATIYRDQWGVPHIDGPTDASCVFAFAYCQAEDYFWQVEDSYILSLGRYAEINGPKQLHSDLMNKMFEVVPRAKADYPNLEPEIRELFEAFVLGLNHYLATHPEVKPRMIQHFEPWHVLAYVRHLTLEMCFRYSGVGKDYMPQDHEEYYEHVGSNAWAVGPSRTKDKKAILFINPHQPWYGFGQFYEAHIRSGEGWNFTGATFFGHPLPSLGFNEYLGWTFTVNEPDVADVWLEKFDKPDDPLAYRYGDTYRKATEWKDTVKIKDGRKFETREYTFRKTHHGPIVSKAGENVFRAVNVAKLNEAILLRQVRKLVRAKNLAEFKAGMSMLNFPIMNTIYADREGNIFYVYNGIVPRRDPSFEWNSPVDGSNPRTDWQGIHPMEELPQLENPPSGFVQSCNSTPFTTSDDGNPFRGDYPQYMVRDKDVDMRRAKMCRHILRSRNDFTFEDMRALAFDTTVYWAMNEFPKFKRQFETLRQTHPELAKKAQPYLDHLLAWDCKITPESTHALLCLQWFDTLYGGGYPAENLKKEYVFEPWKKFEALIEAGERLQSLHGNWKLPYGEVHRIQRHHDVADFYQIPFSDRKPSLPSCGAPGPLGIVFTLYYTPSVFVPFVRETRKRYGVVGPTYLGVVEFGDRVRGATLLQYGESADPKSPHYADQAQLLSDRKLKEAWFHWEDVEANAKRIYHPGMKDMSPVAAGSGD